MALPVKTTLEDVDAVCKYLATKPTGATLADAKAVVEGKHLDGRKLSALKRWGLVEDADGGKLKVTTIGRNYARGDEAKRSAILRNIIEQIGPYSAIIERLAHRREESISATDVAAHWHEHFRGEVGDSDKTINDQAVCFFQLANGAGLGTLTIGRKGSPTRLDANRDALHSIGGTAEGAPDVTPEQTGSENAEGEGEEEHSAGADKKRQTETQLGQAIFVAHGKNKKPLDQLKKILDQFKIPYKVAVEEPNLGRPIGTKVREVMRGCNCAILIFTADEEFTDSAGHTIWRPSENVIHELGAAGYLYDSRIVIMKEDGVDFPSNFKDLGYIAFEKDALDAKAMDILKELIGFGIVKVTT